MIFATLTEGGPLAANLARPPPFGLRLVEIQITALKMSRFHVDRLKIFAVSLEQAVSRFGAFHVLQIQDMPSWSRTSMRTEQGHPIPGCARELGTFVSTVVI